MDAQTPKVSTKLFFIVDIGDIVEDIRPNPSLLIYAEYVLCINVKLEYTTANIALSYFIIIKKSYRILRY